MVVLIRISFTFSSSLEPIVHYIISKLTIAFAAPYYFQKLFTNSEPSCIKDGRKVITKGDSIRFFFSPSGHFQEFVYFLVDIRVRGLEMYHVQDNVSTKFKSARPANKIA